MDHEDALRGPPVAGVGAGGEQEPEGVKSSGAAADAAVLPIGGDDEAGSRGELAFIGAALDLGLVMLGLKAGTGGDDNSGPPRRAGPGAGEQGGVAAGGLFGEMGRTVHGKGTF